MQTAYWVCIAYVYTIFYMYAFAYRYSIYSVNSLQFCKVIDLVFDFEKLFNTVKRDFNIENIAVCGFGCRVSVYLKFLPNFWSNAPLGTVKISCSLILETKRCTRKVSKVSKVIRTWSTTCSIPIPTYLIFLFGNNLFMFISFSLY